MDRRLFTVALAIALGACHKPAPSTTSAASSPHAFAVTASPAMAVPAWFIDPANSTSCASDSNTCQSATCASAGVGPCLTYASIVSRWGTNAPQLRQDTALTFLSSQTNGADPVDFEPVILNGVNVSLQGALPTATVTGTLGGVVQKNRSSGQLLNATLASGLSPGMLIVNSTRGARAWLYKVVSGTTWAISQSLTPYALPLQSSALIPAELDTWSNGDTYSVYSLVKVNIALLRGNLTDISATSFANSLVVYQLTVYEPNASVFNFDPLTVVSNSAVFFVESSIQRYVQLGLMESVISPAFLNCDLASGVVGGSVINANNMIAGQARNPLFAQHLAPDGDAIFGAHNVTGIDLYGAVYLDAELEAQSPSGHVDCATTYNSGQPVIWGPGALNVQGSTRFTYKNSAGATFLNLGGLQLNASSTACSSSNASTNVENCAITLTAAHLDAAQGTAGCGGTCYVKGGASFTIGGK